MAKVERRNGDQWRAIIETYETSGQTVKRFCEERGLGLTSFYSWRKKLVVKTTSIQKVTPERFIELKPTNIERQLSNNNSSFEAVLDLGGGISMTLRRS